MNISSQAFHVLGQVASRAVVAHATELIANRAVQLVALTPIQDGVTGLGVVYPEQGARSESVVSTEVTVTDYGTVSFWCSADQEDMCAHAAATLYLILVEREQAPPVESRPHWQIELEETLPAPDVREQVELCLFFTVEAAQPHRRYGRSYSSVSVRPGMRGTHGKWIRGEATWQSLENLFAPAEQVAALMDFRNLSERANGYYWGSHTDWVDLTALPGPEMWKLLERIHASGIPLVSSEKPQRQVEFTEHFAHIDGLATRTPGQLRIDVELTLDSPLPEGETWWIGTPVVGFVRVANVGANSEHFTLVPLDRPLAPIARRILEGEPLIVPDEDLPAFEEQFFARLAQELPIESRDKSYELPKTPKTTLTLQIHHADQNTQLRWDWQRPVGLQLDPEREQRILATLHDAAGESAHLIWPELVPASRALPRASEPVATAAALVPASATPRTAPARRTLPVDQVLSRGAAAVFVAEVLPALRAVDGLEISEYGERPDYRMANDPLVDVRAEESGDWFDLHVTVDVFGERVTFADLFAALTLGDAVFVLPSGVYFSLIGPEFDQLRAILQEARALVDTDSFDEGIRVNRHNVDLWQELSDLGMVSTQTTEWWRAIRELAPDVGVASIAPPPGLQATLREYQHEGLAWLNFLRTHRLGGILADDMGLGKTLQVIAMMEVAREEDAQLAPFLVVAPTSVVSNWASECAKFAPGLKVSVITAMEGRRGAPLAESVAGAHVVVTSYALFRGEAEAYSELEWSGLVLDEAQQIKNYASRGHRAARTLGAPFTLVVTGTPLENNLLELWSLMSLAAPGLLGSRKKFTEFYRTPIEKDHDADRLALLQRRIRPFLLRRTKDVVAADLPPKQEQVIEIDLHPKHRKLYDVRFQRERQKILGLVGDIAGNQFQIFKSLTMLRQLALDPELVDAGSAPSAKLDALIDLLTEAAEEGHRVLVLSQFTRFLGSARDRATDAGLASIYLDGATTDRGTVIDEFRNGTAPVFFVSLKAGGFGLNLVEADYVVLLDPWWNPAVEAQAIDRAHRIGQDRTVFVYRLVSAKTIEQKVIALRESKAALFEQVLGGNGVGSGALSADDIRALLED